MSELPPDNSGTSQPQPSQPAFAAPPRMYDSRAFTPSGLSIAAFVLGILSFVGCGPCFGIPALVIGLIELQNIKNHSSSSEGRAFALTGAILGGISLALALLFVLVYAIIIFVVILAETAGSGGF